MTIRWEELPFEFEAPNYFICQRRFIGGPIAAVQTTCRLAEVHNGTTIDYTVEFTPRNWISRPIVLTEATLNTKPQIGSNPSEWPIACMGELTRAPEAPPDSS